MDATGEGASSLEVLAKSGERIPGSQLLQIAESVHQVIWGKFAGYSSLSAEIPRVVASAIDSSFWEFSAEDASLLEEIAKFLTRIG